MDAMITFILILTTSAIIATTCSATASLIKKNTFVDSQNTSALQKYMYRWLWVIKQEQFRYWSFQVGPWEEKLIGEITLS